MITSPHGTNIPCNWYCTATHHAVIVLAERHTQYGDPTDVCALIAGGTPYWATLGWHIIGGRRIETDTARVLASLENPVRIDPFCVNEHPLPENLAKYEPWMLIIEPLPESPMGQPS